MESRERAGNLSRSTTHLLNTARIPTGCDSIAPSSAGATCRQLCSSSSSQRIGPAVVRNADAAVVDTRVNWSYWVVCLLNVTLHVTRNGGQRATRCGPPEYLNRGTKSEPAFEHRIA